MSARAGLTGRTRHRVGWRGRLVLQVEVRHFVCDVFDEYPPSARGWQKYWRDARLEDFETPRILQ